MRTAKKTTEGEKKKGRRPITKRTAGLKKGRENEQRAMPPKAYTLPIIRSTSVTSEIPGKKEEGKEGWRLYTPSLKPYEKKKRGGGGRKSEIGTGFPSLFDNRDHKKEGRKEGKKEEGNVVQNRLNVYGRGRRKKKGEVN